jgi:hypothetical protein
MAVRTSVNPRNYIHDNDDEYHRNQTNEYDEEIDETEGDLIENYLYLTQRCGVLRHSPTTSALSTMQQQQLNPTWQLMIIMVILNVHFINLNLVHQ